MQLRKIIFVCFGAAAIATTGCATKTYGRLGPLTSFETSTMTCREIDLDIGRTHGFIQRVNSESQFSGKDVLAFLGDFGIGNSMEKSAAMESATSRLSQLESLRSTKCGATARDGQRPPTVAVASDPEIKTPISTSASDQGQDAYNAEQLAKQQACNATPSPVLVGRGSGFEAYAVTCTNGDTMMIRCELGNCRALR